MTQATLIFVFRGDQVLLAMKKRGNGVGKWNGAGGKIRDGENVRDAAVRETDEELRIRPFIEEPLGRAEYYGTKHSWTVHIFRTDKFQGEPRETEEMRPQWFKTDAMPFDKMWPHDQVWLPYVVDNRRFVAKFWFDKQDRVVKQHLEL